MRTLFLLIFRESLFCSISLFIINFFIFQKAKVDSSIEMLRVRTAELQSIIDQLESQPDTVDPDESVTASNPVYNQYVHYYNSSVCIAILGNKL